LLRRIAPTANLNYNTLTSSNVWGSSLTHCSTQFTTVCYKWQVATQLQVYTNFTAQNANINIEDKFVCLGKITSTLRIINYGVPQGSIFAPYSFYKYITITDLLLRII